MAALLAIAIGVARLSIGEIKLLRDIPGSLIAYYAAEAGIEHALYDEWQSPEGAQQGEGECLTNGGCYSIVEVSRQGDSITIKSNGSYLNTQRLIEVSF